MCVCGIRASFALRGYMTWIFPEKAFLSSHRDRLLSHMTF